MDKSSIGGIALAVGGITLGLVLEGGRVSQILQPTAAIIVFGGTIGAVMLQFPMPVILQAGKQLRNVFFERSTNSLHTVQQLVSYAHQARRAGIVSLDDELNNIVDPFLKRSLMLAVDGTEPEELRKIMESDLSARAEEEELVSRVFESAGGFSPTIGIIGAVLGLIQVMQHLSNMDEVGRGIAVAFVATIYGVGAANLIFLPCAGKLKIRLRQQQALREMTLDGVISILEGMNPHMLEGKLLGYLQENSNQKSSRHSQDVAA
ncbi:MAG TPA: flagellar motor protein [Candidatus Angelobacter sp.]|nr:flagellar motor protein [Candidatus Angelobacter sp.]